MARVGGARVFFDVVGRFQAQRFMADTQAGMQALATVTEGIMMDSMTAIQEGVIMLIEPFKQVAAETVPIATAFAEARIEFTKFARGIEDVNVKEMADDIKELGAGYGFTAEESYKAGSRTAQLSGILKSQEAVIAATGEAIKFGFVGGMGTEEATTRLIQLQQQTGFMFGDTTEAVYAQMDAMQQADLVAQNMNDTITMLNTVENRSAATAAQLTFVMNQFASAATLAGDSLEFMTGASATLIEAGEEQGKAGRALRMIYARLGANTSQNNEIMQQYAGNIRTANGSLKPLQEILGQLDTQWEHLTDQQKLNIAQSVAGNDHYVRFLKLMENYDRTMTLTTQATQRLDSATEELELFTGDPAYQLKILEAELTNVKDEIGQGLVPVMKGATEAEIFWAEGLSLLTNNMNEMVGEDNVQKLFFYVKAFSMLGSQTFDMAINMKNVSIALSTQKVLMQALAGHEVVRRDAYQSSLSMAKAENDLIDRKAKLEAQTAYMRYAHVKVKETDVRMQLIEEEIITQINELVEQQGQLKRNLLTYDQQLVEAQRGIKEQISTTNDQIKARFNTMVAISDMDAQLLTNEVQFRMQSLMMAEHELGLEERRVYFKQLANENEEDRLKFLIANLQAEIQTDKVQNSQWHLSRKRNELKRAEARLTEVQAGQDQEEILRLRERVQLEQRRLEQAQTYLQGHIQRIAVDEGLQLSQQELLQLQDAHNDALLEYAAIQFAVQMATIDRMEAESMEAQVLAELNEILEKFNLSNYKTLDALIKVRVEMKNSESQMRSFGLALGNMDSRLNGFAMGAGVASMAVSFLGEKMGLDSEQSAAAGMIAMTLAMIPMQAQMFLMTAQMMVATEAAATLTIAMRSLAIATGIGFVITGALSLLIAGALKSKSKVDDLNASLDVTRDLISDITGEMVMEEMIAPDFYVKALEAAGMAELADMWVDPMSMTAAELEAQLAVSRPKYEELVELAEESSGAVADGYKRQYEGLGKLNELMEFRLQYLNSEQILAGDAGKTRMAYINQELAALEGAEGYGLGTAIAVAFEEIFTLGFGESEMDRQQDEMLEYATDFAALYALKTGQSVDQVQDDMERFFNYLQMGAELPSGLAESEVYGGAYAIQEAMKEYGFDTGVYRDIFTQFTDMLPDTEDIAESMTDYIKAAQEAGYLTEQEAQVINDAWNMADEEIQAGLVSTIAEDLPQAVNEFGSAMEEFFYGGDYQMLTGDLTKQIIQKGAENLIANTEIIMTNNFHGLTLPQMVQVVVDGVTDELENRGIIA